jgi:tryptophan-rich sensory protein
MNVTILLYSIIVIVLVVLGGNVNTVTSGLQLPSVYPPTYLFGLVWTILFFIFGIFLYYATDTLQFIGIIYFTFVLLWTPLFVHTKSTSIGFYYLVFIVILTIVLYILSITYSHPYPWLLIPQVVWILFATILSYLLYKIN